MTFAAPTIPVSNQCTTKLQAVPLDNKSHKLSSSQICLLYSIFQFRMTLRAYRYPSDPQMTSRAERPFPGLWTQSRFVVNFFLGTIKLTVSLGNLSSIQRSFQNIHGARGSNTRNLVFSHACKIESSQEIGPESDISFSESQYVPCPSTVSVSRIYHHDSHLFPVTVTPIHYILTQPAVKQYSLYQHPFKNSNIAMRVSPSLNSLDTNTQEVSICISTTSSEPQVRNVPFRSWPQ